MSLLPERGRVCGSQEADIKGNTDQGTEEQAGIQGLQGSVKSEDELFEFFKKLL